MPAVLLRPEGPRARTYAEFSAEIRPALDEALATELRRVLGAHRAPPLAEGLDGLTRGKKTRGTLLCLLAAALGADPARALTRAVAVELIQAATLVHDDFVDGHRTRRGLPSLWTHMGPRRAVLLGDVLFSHAIHMMTAQGPEEGAVVAAAIADIARGALAEPLDAAALADDIEQGRLTGELYGAIVRLKTAALFGVACELAALAAGAVGDSRQRWRDYGLIVGEAYQLTDDRHDILRCLARRACDASDLVALAPALLFFVREARAGLPRLARRAPLRALGELAPQLATAHAAMTARIERHLADAARLAAREVLADGSRAIVREAPRALIQAFDAANAATL